LNLIGREAVERIKVIYGILLREKEGSHFTLLFTRIWHLVQSPQSMMAPGFAEGALDPR
jgi:hypothetical protein